MTTVRNFIEAPGGVESTTFPKPAPSEGGRSGEGIGLRTSRGCVYLPVRGSAPDRQVDPHDASRQGRGPSLLNPLASRALSHRIGSRFCSFHRSSFHHNKSGGQSPLGLRPPTPSHRVPPSPSVLRCAPPPVHEGPWRLGALPFRTAVHPSRATCVRQRCRLHDLRCAGQSGGLEMRWSPTSPLVWRTAGTCASLDVGSAIGHLVHV